MVFCGLFDRYPKLNIITHHLGGMIPFYDGRVGPGLQVLGARTLDEDYSKVLPSLKRPHLDYLHDFYGDTAMFGGGIHAVRCGLDFFGADHVVFATDTPLGPIKPTIDVIKQLDISDADRRKIFAGNAARLRNSNSADPGGQAMPTIRRSILCAAACAGTRLLLCSPVFAAEKLRVGKAVPEAFSFVPLDIAMRKGFFAKAGLEIELIAFAGDARMQQAMASDSLDIALGSGPAMAFIVKGAPIKASPPWPGRHCCWRSSCARTGRRPRPTSRARRSASRPPARSPIGWSARPRAARLGSKGIEIAPMGAMPGQIAALKRGDIDGVIMDIGNAFDLEKRGEGRILVRFTDIRDFHIHVIFATDKLIAGKPEAARGFLKGWFETIAFMRKNKAETVAIANDVTHKDEAINARVYDELMPMFSDSGKFDPAALATLSKSYVELQLLPAEPDMSKLFTEAFLPK